MKKTRLVKRVQKQNKKAEFKQELKALQKEHGNDVAAYRTAKAQLEKQHGYSK